MQKGKIKLVSFDCGGTLYYEVEEDYIIFQRILNKLGYRLEVSMVKDALNNARQWWRREKEKSNKIWNENTWLSLLREMAKNLSLPTPDHIACQLRSGWLTEAKFKAYEDAEPTLKQLKDAGFQTIAISNVSSKRNLTTYLEKAGLLHYFSVIVASGDVGHEKPDPEIFKVASQTSKVPLASMLHVSDKYEEDYVGAQSAGAEAILIDRKGIHKNKECQKISRLTELIDILL